MRGKRLVDPAVPVPALCYHDRHGHSRLPMTIRKPITRSSASGISIRTPRTFANTAIPGLKLETRRAEKARRLTLLWQANPPVGQDAPAWEKARPPYRRMRLSTAQALMCPAGGTAEETPVPKDLAAKAQRRTASPQAGKARPAAEGKTPTCSSAPSHSAKRKRACAPQRGRQRHGGAVQPPLLAKVHCLNFARLAYGEAVSAERMVGRIFSLTACTGIVFHSVNPHPASPPPPQTRN